MKAWTLIIFISVLIPFIILLKAHSTEVVIMEYDDEPGELVVYDYTNEPSDCACECEDFEGGEW